MSDEDIEPFPSIVTTSFVIHSGFPSHATLPLMPPSPFHTHSGTHIRTFFTRPNTFPFQHFQDALASLSTLSQPGSSHVGEKTRRCPSAGWCSLSFVVPTGGAGIRETLRTSFDSAFHACENENTLSTI